MLIVLKIFFGSASREHNTKVRIMPTWTDNRGNGSALNKMMASRYPSSAVVMEMSVFMKRNGLKALVEWTPESRQQYEVKINPEELQWYILPKALEIGEQAEKEH